MPQIHFIEDREIAFQYLYDNNLIAQARKESRRTDDGVIAAVSHHVYGKNSDMLRMRIYNWVAQPLTKWLKDHGYPDPRAAPNSARNENVPILADVHGAPVEEAVVTTSSWTEERRLLTVKSNFKRAVELVNSMATIPPDMCQLMETFVENVEKATLQYTLPPRRRRGQPVSEAVGPKRFARVSNVNTS